MVCLKPRVTQLQTERPNVYQKSWTKTILKRHNPEAMRTIVHRFKYIKIQTSRKHSRKKLHRFDYIKKYKLQKNNRQLKTLKDTWHVRIKYLHIIYIRLSFNILTARKQPERKSQTQKEKKNNNKGDEQAILP